VDGENLLGQRQRKIRWLNRLFMEFYYTRTKLLGYQFGLVLAIALLLYGIYTFPNDGKMFICGWFGIVLIAISMIISMPILMKSESQVIINNRGIQDKRQKLGLIPWDSIRAIYIKSYYVRGIKLYYYMVIEPNNPEAYKSRISQTRIGSSDENSPFAISFQLLKPSIKDATEFITSHHPSIIIKDVG
jgi:hypothetical protein